MASHGNRSWTLFGLISAFLELAFAYLLLCGSVCTFFVWSFFHVFGLYLPCPCTGFLGYRNRNLCLHKLFYDLPMRKIDRVRTLAKNRLPFDVVWTEDQENESDLKLVMDRKWGNGVVGLDNATCSSSVLGSRFQKLVEREGGYDVKGKKIMIQKQKTGLRLRRKPVLGCGKFPSFVSKQAVVSNNGSGIRSEVSDGFVDHIQDDSNAGAWSRIEEVDGTNNENYEMGKVSSSIGSSGNETDLIRMLENDLQEEKSARASLYMELEKERAASASAADEAMAMIVRLQEEKAILEMEARQYGRMIEEKFAYDEEEMNIMKEMLVKRERENHFLEKKLEAYRQMDMLDDEGSEVNPGYMIPTDTHLPWGLNEDLPIHQSMAESSTGNYKASNSYVLSPHNHGLVEKSSTLVGKEVTHGVCKPKFESTKTSGGAIVKSHSCSEIELEKDEEKSSSFDKEPIIYDVHVIDDKTELRKDETRRDTQQVVFGNSEVWTDESSSSDFSIANMVEYESRLTQGNLHNDVSLLDPRKTSSSVSSDRLKIEEEVKRLKERLRVVLEENEKLTSSAEERESINVQFKHVEEMVNQLQDAQQTKEPV